MTTPRRSAAVAVMSSLTISAAVIVPFALMYLSLLPAKIPPRGSSVSYPIGYCATVSTLVGSIPNGITFPLLCGPKVNAALAPAVIHDHVSVHDHLDRVGHLIKRPD